MGRGARSYSHAGKFACTEVRRLKTYRELSIDRARAGGSLRSGVQLFQSLDPQKSPQEA